MVWDRAIRGRLFAEDLYMRLVEELGLGSVKFRWETAPDLPHQVLEISLSSRGATRSCLLRKEELEFFERRAIQNRLIQALRPPRDP